MATQIVTYSKKGDVHTIDTGAGVLGNIVIDNTGVPENQRGGTAKQLLGAATIFCYASALNGALEARGASASDVSIKAIMEVGGNELGQGRVKKITLEARVTLPESDQEIFERCEKIMRQGCLITGSLHDGIHMEYDLQPIYKD